MCHCLKSKAKKSKERTIRLNHLSSTKEDAHRTNKDFCNNKIITSHYTWWNFIFLNLFEQFHSVANFFFVLVSVMYFYGETPIAPGTTIGPLGVVIGISIIKDFCDDLKRHINDYRFNNIPFLVWCHFPDKQRSEWTQVKSHKIRSGDIVVCKEGDSFPCDLLILASSHANGKVYETTGNIDGETSVKAINSLAVTQASFGAAISSLKHPENLEYFGKFDFPPAKIICEPPAPDFKSFEGRLEYDEFSVPLLLDNLALRGATLRHTRYIIGAVIYTGDETKLSLNGQRGARKFSATAGRFNDILLFFMGSMFVLTVIFVGLQFAWRQTTGGKGWYFFFKPTTAWSVVQEGLTLTFLMNYLIPISIVVTMEVLQLFLALFMATDIDLYDPESNTRSEINATNIADELGQIEFLFSDKTGTLTQNKMEFRCFTLTGDDSIYRLEENDIYIIRDGQKFSDIYKSTQIDLKVDKWIEEDKYISSSSEEDEDPSVSEKLTTARRNSIFKLKVVKLPKKADSFWMAASLCHTIEAKIYVDEETGKESVVYNAPSPDERALVEAAAKCGYEYVGKEDDENGEAGNERDIQLIRCKKSGLDASGPKENLFETKRMKLDGIIEFDSIRKRMSVLVQDSNEKCFVYTKGAEISMLNPLLCGRTSPEIRDDIMKKVNNFACTGLRTLVFAKREVPKDEYKELVAELKRAQGLIGKERLQALETVHGKIESQMKLIGVSGVEDKLQPGVKKCLRSLISAGIQVWVLTGDKEETAVQVSQSAGHFPPGLTIIRLTDGQNLEEVARSIYVQAEGMRARLDAKRQRRRWKWPFGLTNGEKGRNAVDAIHRDDVTFESSSSISNEIIDLDAPPVRNGLVQRINCGVRDVMVGGLRRTRRKNPGLASEAVGLVIDGQTLRYAISPVLRKDFLKLCMNVTTVLCCRMTPLQKAAIVKLVSTGLEGVGGGGAPVTAAIGDGGNDVAMLLEASVGIGIFGNEGRQAVRASDYAVPLFKNIKKLILVHGHWNYYRVSIMANIFYFKCVAFVALHVYHLFYNGFSGQSLFESLLYTLYNLTMTSWSPFCFALFEQHLTAKELIHRPYLYRLISRNANLRTWYVAVWCLDGWWHGTVVFYVAYYLLVGGGNFCEAVFTNGDTAYAGFENDLFGTAIFIYLTVSTNFRVLIHSRTINLVTIIGMLVTGFANMILMYAYQEIVGPYSVLYKNYTFLATSPVFWLAIPVMLIFCLLPDILWRIISDAWWGYHVALSGVKRIRERQNRQAWKRFANRFSSGHSASNITLTRDSPTSQ